MAKVTKLPKLRKPELKKKLEIRCVRGVPRCPLTTDTLTSDIASLCIPYRCRSPLGFKLHRYDPQYELNTFDCVQGGLAISIHWEPPRRGTVQC